MGVQYTVNENISFSDDLEAYESFWSAANDTATTLLDFRLFNTAVMSAKMSDWLSLQLSHRLAFDNQPVIVDVANEDGSTTAEPLQRVDSTLTLTFVASIF